MRFAIVPIHLPKVPAPATKKWGQVIRSAAPVTQNHLSKLEYLRHQNATPLTKSVPWPPNICDKHVSCTAPATRNVSLQILFKCPTLANVFCQCYKTMTFFSFLGRCRILCAYRAKPYPNLKKCSETAFDFEMCFAPQRRAPFEHLNFQKCSEHGVLCTFWLRNVLRATAAPQRRALFEHLNFQRCSKHGVSCTFCLPNVLRTTAAFTFSTSQFLKVLRSWGALYLLTWVCATTACNFSSLI